jgi:hypothetical protein
LKGGKYGKTNNDLPAENVNTLNEISVTPQKNKTQELNL